MLGLIFDRLPQSRVIITGDFNERKPDIDKLIKKFRLNPVIQEGTVTHQKGNHLDQIYTNLKIIGWR